VIFLIFSKPRRDFAVFFTVILIHPVTNISFLFFYLFVFFFALPFVIGLLSLIM